MASIATLLSNLGMLQKLLGMLRKDGLPDDFFQRLIDERKFRREFVAWAKQRFNQSSIDKPETIIPLWERIDNNSIRVNLDATPKLPFKGAKVKWNEGSGSVTVERCGDDLFVDGQRIVFHPDAGQQTGSIQGYELRTQLQDQRTLHTNVLDALFENQHLLPENWKLDEQSQTRFIYFWAVGFRDASGRLFVRCLYWCDDGWHCDGGWLASAGASSGALARSSRVEYFGLYY